MAQIADGENGGVMMNEFPAAFEQANHRLRDDGQLTAAINGTEYLEWVEASASAWRLPRYSGQSAPLV